MSSKIEYRPSPHDQSIWPPHAWLFVVVSMLLTANHALSGLLLFFFYLDFHIKTALVLIAGTGLIFIILNIRLTRGHLSSLLGLEVLAAIYSAIAVSSLFGISGTPVKLGMSLFMITTSALAWISIRSNKYRAMADVIAKRWAFYRATGRTVMEELALQDKVRAKRARRDHQ